ncbi:Rho guanine nucleotide exchange factor [Marasmius crinis-equi]|uniref:Rho guanine nucleotide exchange factor n=1 Tax=Marasmius crinis-equi TaxID=585013 RepID=A0ABR3FHF7_9AGAR
MSRKYFPKASPFKVMEFANCPSNEALRHNNDDYNGHTIAQGMQNINYGRDQIISGPGAFAPSNTERAGRVCSQSSESSASSADPECLWIEHVKDLSKRPVEFGGLADIWTGKIGNTKVAVKAVRHRLSANKEEQVSAFVREAMSWRESDHPNILPFDGVYYFDEDKQQICLVSPWMENGNLLKYLQEQNTNVDATQRQALAKDVAQGLSYLHQLQITHGDLKGYNVLIAQDGTARIDFGLSKVRQLHGFSAMAGQELPVRWLAPELLSGGKNTPESDIYAYGCVCFEIYAATVPFEGVEEHEIYLTVAVEKGYPDFPANAPRNMVQLMRSCWHKSPQSRPAASQLVELGSL